MARRPVQLRRRGPAADPGRGGRPARAAGRSSLRSLVAVQLGALLLVAGYLTRAPLLPDHGLQQLDALTLHEEVAGISALDGLPTLVVATGPLTDEECREGAVRLLRDRGTADGIPARHAVVLLVPAPADLGPLPPGTAVQVDGDGELTARLALPRAVHGCQPGYAVVDPTGSVRYRSYDARYAEHAVEQRILLDATARAEH